MYNLYPDILVRLSCTPAQFLMGALLFIRTPYMRDKVVLKTKPAWARFKMHGFDHNPLCDFQKLGIDLQTQSYLSGYLS